MNAIHIHKTIDSETLHLPELKPLIGKTVEIIVREQEGSAGLESLNLDQFEFEGRRYQLKEPLTLTVEYADKMWTYHNEEVNLWGTGERREEALLDLQANFDYLFREFAEEQDIALDAKAQQIKHKLFSLVDQPNVETK